jgi:hypothetical protein
MFTSHGSRSGVRGRKGIRPAEIAELRRDLARPSSISDGNRQRLLDLARRVAQINSLGGEYRRVSLSEHAQAAIGDAAVV